MSGDPPSIPASPVCLLWGWRRARSDSGRKRCHSQHSFGIVITVWRPRVQQCTMGMCPAECSMGRVTVGRRRGGVRRRVQCRHTWHTRGSWAPPLAPPACPHSRYSVLCIVHSYTQLYPVILSYSQLKISYTKLYRAALREVTGDTVAATRAATPTPILGR